MLVVTKVIWESERLRWCQQRGVNKERGLSYVMVNRRVAQDRWPERIELCELKEKKHRKYYSSNLRNSALLVPAMHPLSCV